MVNQMSQKHELTIPSRGDFLVDGKYTLEIGGKGKKTKQIEGLPNACLVLDDIELGYQQTIPLYLFGMLY